MSLPGGIRLSYWLRYFISGRTQSGKSTFAKKILPYLKSFIVYDCIKREFGPLGTIVHDINGLCAALSAGIQRIIIQPHDPSVEVFDTFCEYLFKHVRHTLFVVDEVHMFATKSFIPMGFKKIITIGQGEQFRIGVMAMTQRPANTHNDIIGNSTVMVTFAASHIRDAKAVNDSTGIPEQDILNLQDHYFILYDARNNPRIQHCTPLA
jgi:DNA helicase HerA-like ATPase